MKRLLRRPSPAMVIAMVALLAALGGTAVGATVLSKKTVKKISNTQANKVFDQRKGELTGPPGPPGASGINGSAAAFALIQGNHSVNAAESFNVTDANVTNPSTGVYCIGGLPFQPKNAVATPQATSALDSRDRIAAVLVSTAPGIPFGCAAGDSIRVQIIDNGVLGATAAGFANNFVQVWIED